jgi:hypothetical protein
MFSIVSVYCIALAIHYMNCYLSVVIVVGAPYCLKYYLCVSSALCYEQLILYVVLRTKLQLLSQLAPFGLLSLYL